MNIFVFEFVTGGGLLVDPALHSVAPGLAVEGFAMLRSLVADFAAIETSPGTAVEVATIRHADAWNLLGNRQASFSNSESVKTVDVSAADQVRTEIRRLAGESDWTIVIAPELNGHLSDIAREVEQAGGVLLSPNSEFIAVAADKLRTFEVLDSANCPTVQTLPFTRESAQKLLAHSGRVVIKPRFGCGSESIRLIDHPTQPGDVSDKDADWIVQPFVAGTAVSVSAISGLSAGHAAIETCEPCYQNIAPANSSKPFSYTGGCLPVRRDLRDRAMQLARTAISCLPNSNGMCGVDLLLGDDPSGRSDVVVEINPRLTTSYIGLREAAETNLAAAMIAAARGERIDLSFSDLPVTFSCSDILAPADARADVTTKVCGEGLMP